jgi:rod shape-determining protein MreD
MSNLFFLPFLLAIVIAQSTILNYFRFFGVKPDLLLGFTVIAGIYLDWRWALPLAILAGLSKDIFGTASIGINIFLTPFWCYLVMKLSKKISIDDAIAVSVTAFLAVLLNDITIRLLYLYSGKSISHGIFLRIAFIEPLYTALALPFLIKAFVYVRDIPRYIPETDKTDPTG